MQTKHQTVLCYWVNAWQYYYFHGERKYNTSSIIRLDSLLECLLFDKATQTGDRDNDFTKDIKSQMGSFCDHIN